MLYPFPRTAKLAAAPDKATLHAELWANQGEGLACRQTALQPAQGAPDLNQCAAALAQIAMQTAALAQLATQIAQAACALVELCNVASLDSGPCQHNRDHHEAHDNQRCCGNDSLRLQITAYTQLRRLHWLVSENCQRTLCLQALGELLVQACLQGIGALSVLAAAG